MPHCVTMRRASSRGALEIVRGAGGHLVHEQLLGDAAAEQHRDHGEQPVAVLAVAVLGRQLHRHAERAAARDDGHLVHRIGLGQQARDDRVAGLVIGGVAALFLGHDHRAALGAHDDLVLGALEVVHLDQALVAARGEQRRFVHQVGEVGAREAGRAARDDVGLDVRRERHLAHVHLEDLLAAADVGQRHDHLAVEAARAQQRRVEHVGPVGGGDDDHAHGAPRSRPSRRAAGSASARARRCRRRGRRRAGGRPRRSRR